MAFGHVAGGDVGVHAAFDPVHGAVEQRSVDQAAFAGLVALTQRRFIAGKSFVIYWFGFALVAAFLYLAWLVERPRLLVPAFLIALAFAGGLSLSGHNAVDPGSSWRSEAADWVHLTAVSLWIGGLAALVAGAPEVAYGVVVTASHNPVEYNGLKVLGRNGRKIPDAEERALEALMALGYNLNDATVALESIPKDLPTAERVTLALRG